MRTIQVYILLALGSLCATTDPTRAQSESVRPNFLIAISDDQSFPHASAYGCRGIETPSFDRIARAGILFTNAFTPAPGCSPMRAAFLTGRHIWQIEHAGTHASSFPKKYETFQHRLEAAGYAVGFTGKGWGPGNFKISGRTQNPAGPAYQKRKMQSPKGIRNTDYAVNFADFLEQRAKGAPFSFWFGASEPHRGFKKGSGVASGMKLEDAAVPPFLPDTPEIRSDILDYYYEIQWFDQHLGRMLDLLEKRGELANTVVIVTSDNGMAFPRAKANVYEYGIHMPLAIAWPARVPPSRTATDPVDLLDVSATIYQASGVAPPETHGISGRGLLALLTSKKSGRIEPERDAVYSGRERHSSSRFRSLGYPQRCVRTADHLYIKNFRPERWPAGAPRKLKPRSSGYHDIDGSPSLTFLLKNRDDAVVAKFLDLATAKRPAEELYDIRKDPGCLHNLAGEPKWAELRASLADRLEKYLRKTGDPRVVHADGGDIFETYPRYSGLRRFPLPDWARRDPSLIPPQAWLDKRQPR